MDLDDLFGPTPTVVDLKAKSRWEAIDELINSLVATNKVKPEHAEAIAGAVKKRESSMSTGIGFGIGLPHASTDLISEPTATIGRSRNGIQFDTIDGQLVNLVVLFLVPQGQFEKHLHTLANIAKLLQSSSFRDQLRRRFL